MLVVVEGCTPIQTLSAFKINQPLENEINRKSSIHQCQNYIRRPRIISASQRRR